MKGAERDEAGGVYMPRAPPPPGMAQQFYSALQGGGPTFPNSIINGPGVGPLPPTIAPSYASEGFKGPDGRINDRRRLLENLASDIYTYGPNPRRIETQTQNNHPNKVQRIIPKLFLPAAQSDSSVYQDPVLEHATTDGDVVFSLKMNRDMTDHGSKYVIYPMGYSERAIKVVNLATLNYILWGLQVGSLLPAGNRMWLAFFRQLCKTQHEPLLRKLEGEEGGLSLKEMIWNFIKTYFDPFGVQHGFDTQGGQHEGSKTKAVAHAVDYVSAFALEGKLLKVNNLWKTCDVFEDDDVVLALRQMKPQSMPLVFNLSSSNRSIRTERAPVPMAWWYLQPEALEYKSIIETPHIHIGRSQKMVTAYAKPNFGNDMPAWNARSAIQGTPLQMTFEPCFVDSDDMYLKYDIGVKPRASKMTTTAATTTRQAATMGEEEEGQQVPQPVATGTHAFLPQALAQKRPHPDEEAFRNALSSSAPMDKPKKKKPAAASAAASATPVPAQPPPAT